MYPQVIEELKALGQLSGDRNEVEFASALEQGFRSGAGRALSQEALQSGEAQRKTGYSLQ